MTEHTAQQHPAVRGCDPATPHCGNCGHKFAGDPCRFCAADAAVGPALREQRMPHNTRRTAKHGRVVRTARA